MTINGDGAPHRSHIEGGTNQIIIIINISINGPYPPNLTFALIKFKKNYYYLTGSLFNLDDD